MKEKNQSDIIYWNFQPFGKVFISENPLTCMFFNNDSHITNQSISPADQQRNVKIPEKFSQAQQCTVRKNIFIFFSDVQEDSS